MNINLSDCEPSPGQTIQKGECLECGKKGVARFYWTGVDLELNLRDPVKYPTTAMEIIDHICRIKRID